MTRSLIPEFTSFFGKTLFPSLLDLLRTFTPIAILNALTKISELVPLQSEIAPMNTKKKYAKQISSKKEHLSFLENSPDRPERPKKIVSFRNPPSVLSNPDLSIPSPSHKDRSASRAHSSFNTRNDYQEIIQDNDGTKSYSSFHSIFSSSLSSSPSSPTNTKVTAHAFAADINTTNMASSSNLAITTLSIPSTPHEILTEVCEIMILASSAIIGLLELNPLFFASLIIATIITLPIWIVVTPVVCIFIGLLYFQVVPVAYIFLWTGLKVSTGIKRLRMNRD